MSETKFTPGPWVVRESSVSLSVSVVSPNGEVIFHESDKRIPGVMGDAHLIAAAPDLYEVLSEAVNNNMEVENADWWNKVHKALAKAHGELKE